MSGDLLVGAARHSLEPPLDLPLVGFVRQTHDATGYGRWGLETSAIALVAPDCERILIETGVRAAEELFPDATPWDWEQVDGVGGRYRRPCRRIRSFPPTAPER